MASSSPPPPPSASSSQGTKLPRFIRNQQGRDRSRSTSTYLDPSIPAIALSPGTQLGTNGAPPSSATSIRKGLPKNLGRGLTKKRSRLLGRGSDSDSKASSSDRDTASHPSPPPSMPSPSSSPPMILTTPTSPQTAHAFGPRARNSFQSSRAPSSFDPGVPGAAAGGVLPSNASIISTSTTLHHRLSDIPGRFTGWLGAHFTPPSPNPGAGSMSSSPSSYPGTANYAVPSPTSSQPASANSSAVGNHRHSGLIKGSGAKAPGPIERAIRYVFDSDANPDRSEMPIWLLGTQYPGWSGNGDPQVTDRSPSQSPVQHSVPIPIPNSPQREGVALAHQSTNSLSSSNSVGLYAAPNTAPGQQQQPQQPLWPPTFHASFSSLIYLTYRSHFKPIPPSHPPLPPPSAIDYPTPLPAISPPPSIPNAPESPNRRWLAWVPGRSELTSDAGWGCMLRTGQMVLANALVSLHVPPLPPAPIYANNIPLPALPPPESDKKRYDAYVRILVWFLDDPSVLCPFSVHRLALAGAEMGREVGHWFGPSIAAGSIKKLVSAFPSSGLGVVVPPDQIIHETAVFTASHSPTLPSSTSVSSTARDRETRERAAKMKEEWGDRAVLILIGLRLGIDGVNPIYYDSVKALFTFPQTVGIAGGRPSSSYYFVGTQGDHLFYLDPHSTRTAVPLRVPTEPAQAYDSTYQFTMPEMKTFHCEKVRKMHISGLDPSMLCGFVVRNLEEWRDLRARVDALAKAAPKAPIFTIADAPAAWEMQDADDMSDIGMESISSDSMSVDHEFDEPEHDVEDRELNTPTVAQHARHPPAGVVMIGDHGEEEDADTSGMVQSPATSTDADADADLDDDWEQTPGLRSPGATTASSSASNSSSAGGPRAETPVLVPFPLDPNPSPNGTRRASFGAQMELAAVERGRERERERETAKTLVPASRGAMVVPLVQAPPKGGEPEKRHARERSRELLAEKEKGGPPATPAPMEKIEGHRERVTAMSPPAQSKHHHHHHHSHKPSNAPKPSSIPTDSSREKPQPRLPTAAAASDLARVAREEEGEMEEGEMSPPEELRRTESMEFALMTPTPGGKQGQARMEGSGQREPSVYREAREASQQRQEREPSASREHRESREPRERREEREPHPGLQRSMTSSQWEKVEVS